MSETTALKIWSDESQLTQVKQIFAPNLTTLEFSTFIEMGKATDLNPFLKEIWAVKYGNSPAQIFIGRDGYRKSAQRNPSYDYHTVDAVYSNDTFEVQNGEVSHRYCMQNRGELVGAYCVVQRKSASRATYVFVEVKEYNKGQSVWKDKPATMIKKVAEAQGLRMAFQELFSGTYDESEAWNANQYSESKRSSYTPNKVTGSEFSTLDVLPMVSLHEVKDQIENAKSKSDLAKAAKAAQSLSDEDKALIRPLYNEKKAQFEAAAV